MKFSRVFLNRLQNQPPAHDTVVVIDVLRSFTTAAVALDRGAAAIYPVEGVSAGIVLAGLLDNAVSVGAIAGGEQVHRQHGQDDDEETRPHPPRTDCFH